MAQVKALVQRALTRLVGSDFDEVGVVHASLRRLGHGVMVWMSARITDSRSNHLPPTDGTCTPSSLIPSTVQYWNVERVVARMSQWTVGRSRHVMEMW